VVHTCSCCDERGFALAGMGWGRFQILRGWGEDGNNVCGMVWDGRNLGEWDGNGNKLVLPVKTNSVCTTILLQCQTPGWCPRLP